MANFDSLLIPLMLFGITAYAFFRKCDIYSSFTEGVKMGFDTVKSLFPAIFALFISVGVFRASGLLTMLENLLSPIADFFRFPKELIPFALLRPVSGSGSLAFASDIFSRFGPDSFIGRAISVMMGSTETTFYVTAVYFGACGTKNVRHTLKCALLADAFSIAVSIMVTYFYW